MVKPIPYPAVLDFFVNFPDVTVQFEKDAIIKTLLDV